VRSWVLVVAAGGLVAGCSAGAAAPRSAAVHPADTIAAGAGLGGADSRSCPAGSAKKAITLRDTVPVPEVTVPLGAELVVTVPYSSKGTASDVTAAVGWILREECTALLPDGGRRTIFLAAEGGSTRVDATVEPAGGPFMPNWGGEVIVRGRLSAKAPSPQSSPGTP
jgi:hypothetical protein